MPTGLDAVDGTDSMDVENTNNANANFDRFVEDNRE